MDGAQVALVAAWPGGKRIAWLVEATDVIAERADGWHQAVDRLADYTELGRDGVLEDQYTVEKQRSDVRYVLAWRLVPIRPLDLPWPDGLRFGGNGWLEAGRGELGIHERDTLGVRVAKAGRRLDVESRRAVETYAVARVMQWCDGNGWKDVRHVGDDVVDGERRSWDLEGTVHGRARRIEVKGTTGALGKVTVTRKEVEAATGDPDHLMSIVHDIELGVGTRGEIVASGGRVKIYDPWLPADDELCAVSYEWGRQG